MFHPVHSGDSFRLPNAFFYNPAFLLHPALCLMPAQTILRHDPSLLLLSALAVFCSPVPKIPQDMGLYRSRSHPVPAKYAPVFLSPHLLYEDGFPVSRRDRCMACIHISPCSFLWFWTRCNSFHIYPGILPGYFPSLLGTLQTAPLILHTVPGSSSSPEGQTQSIHDVFCCTYRINCDGTAFYFQQLHQQERDKKMLRKINQLIRDIQRTPFEGIGHPEPLSGNLSGWWSRHIDGKNRIVYKVSVE